MIGVHLPLFLLYCDPFRVSVSVNGTLVESKICTICTFTLESTHFTFNKSLIYTHDGAKFSTNLHETDYSVASVKSMYESQLTGEGKRKGAK
jgi:hypothetical protein